MNGADRPTGPRGPATMYRAGLRPLVLFVSFVAIPIWEALFAPSSRVKKPLFHPPDSNQPALFRWKTCPHTVDPRRQCQIPGASIKNVKLVKTREFPRLKLFRQVMAPDLVKKSVAYPRYSVVVSALAQQVVVFDRYGAYKLGSVPQPGVGRKSRKHPLGARCVLSNPLRMGQNGRDGTGVPVMTGQEGRNRLSGVRAPVT